MDSTPIIAAPNSDFGHVMATTGNWLRDAGQVDLDAFGSNVDEHNLEPSGLRVLHHLEIISSE